jgi:hypothetical protein
MRGRQDAPSGVFIAEGSPIGPLLMDAARKNGFKQRERGPLLV